MKRAHCLGVALLFAATGCSGTPTTAPPAVTEDKHEAAMKETIAILDELSGVLETVKDKETAKAAAAKFKGIEDKFAAVAKKAKDLGEPPADKKDALEKKFEAALKKSTERMQKAMGDAVGKSGGDPEFLKAFQELGKSMQAIGGQ